MIERRIYLVRGDKAMLDTHSFAFAPKPPEEVFSDLSGKYWEILKSLLAGVRGIRRRK